MKRYAILFLTLFLSIPILAAEPADIVFDVDLVLGDRDDAPLLGQILSVAEDSQGRIYLGDRQQSRVFVFGPEGGYIEALGQAGEGPGDLMSQFQIITDKQDRILFVGQTGRLEIVAADWTPVATRARANPASAASGLALLPDGGLVIAAFNSNDNTTLDLYDADYVLVRSFSEAYIADGELPEWARTVFAGGVVATNGDGTIYYAQRTPYAVRAFDATGRLLAETVEGADDFVLEPTVTREEERISFRLDGLTNGIWYTSAGLLVVSVRSGDEGVESTRWCLYDPDLGLLARRDFSGHRRVAGTARDGRIYLAGETEDSVTIERAVLGIR